MARAYEAVGQFHARIEGDEIAHADAQRFRFLVGGNFFIQAHFHCFRLAFGFAGFRAVHVRGSQGEQDGATDALAVTGEDSAALPLHRVPGIAANHAHGQAPRGFNDLDHGTQGIHMRGQRAGSVVLLTFQSDQQRAFARARSFRARQGAEHALGERQGFFGEPGGAGGFEQIHQETGEQGGINNR